MTEREAIFRLNKRLEELNIFKENIDMLELEANTLAIQALNNQIWLKNLLADYYKDPTAVRGAAMTHDLCRVFLYPQMIEEAKWQSGEMFDKLIEKYDKKKRFPEPWEGENDESKN